MDFDCLQAKTVLGIDDPTLHSIFGIQKGGWPAVSKAYYASNDTFDTDHYSVSPQIKERVEALQKVIDIAVKLADPKTWFQIEHHWPRQNIKCSILKMMSLPGTAGLKNIQETEVFLVL